MKLPLLEILFDQRRLFAEKLHVLMRCFEKAAKGSHRLLERLGKFALFLVSPGGFQPAQAAIQALDQGLKVVIESIEIGRETSQLGRINLCFGHTNALVYRLRQYMRNRRRPHDLLWPIRWKSRVGVPYNRQTVRHRGFIFTLLLSITMLSAFASPTNGTCTQPSRANAEQTACCKSHRQSDNNSSVPVDGSNADCVMQCCRLIVIPVTALASLDIQPAANPSEPLSPTVLHSLASPEAIFHPPRM
jgi:hypothetical protein